MQLLLHEAAHLQHLVAYFFQVFVEAPGNVVGEISGFHEVYLYDTPCRLHPIAPRVNSMGDKCEVKRSPPLAAPMARHAAGGNGR